MSENPAASPSDMNETEEPARPSPRLLEFLVCPVTKTTLAISADRSELISRTARLAYPIRDGIPMLTRETARELKDDELK
jgi:uncharacterized protein YbaR (Trm112 family)